MIALLSRRAVVAAVLVIACLEVATAADAPRRIEIQSVPVISFDNRDPERRRFGALEFLGGLVLSSPDKGFGELSGLRIAPDGERFISLTDTGHWVRGRLRYRDGRPVAVEDAEIAPILGADGNALGDKRHSDTEALADDGGTLYVGTERVHRILRFDYARDGLLARGVEIEIPAAARSLPYNEGIEALAFVPRGQPLGGTLIAISERGLDVAGNILGFLIGGPTPGTFTVRRTKDFDVTDAVMLPDGDLIILERFYSPSRGVAMRIRRVPQSAIRPGAVIDGPVLIEADLGYQIDNMEGIAAHQAASGETVLTIVSDDNFSPIQRTLLLQFALVD